MQYDKELIAHKLDRWDRFITDYHLPEWDAIPIWGCIWTRWWCCWPSI